MLIKSHLNLIEYLTDQIKDYFIRASRSGGIEEINALAFVNALVAQSTWSSIRLSYGLAIEIYHGVIDRKHYFEAMAEIDSKTDFSKLKATEIFHDIIKRSNLNHTFSNYTSSSSKVKYAKVITFESLGKYYSSSLGYTSFPYTSKDYNDFARFILRKFRTGTNVTITNPVLWTGENKVVFILPLQDLETFITMNKADTPAKVCNYIGVNFGYSGAIPPHNPHLIYVEYPETFDEANECAQPTALQKSWLSEFDYFLSFGNDGSNYGKTFNLDCCAAFPANERVHRGLNSPSIELKMNLLGECNQNMIDDWINNKDVTKLENECIIRLNGND